MICDPKGSHSNNEEISRNVMSSFSFCPSIMLVWIDIFVWFMNMNSVEIRSPNILFNQYRFIFISLTYELYQCYWCPLYQVIMHIIKLSYILWQILCLPNYLVYMNDMSTIYQNQHFHLSSSFAQSHFLLPNSHYFSYHITSDYTSL